MVDMKKEMLPVDLGRLEDGVIAIVDAFRKANSVERSPEYREYHLKKAESLAKTLQQNFDHSFDTYKIGGVVPYGLNE